MSYVIYIAGSVAAMEMYPELMEHVGRYLVHYDPWRAPKGEQWLWTTASQDEALEFENQTEAHAFWTQSIGTRPWDGKPDRPLTAYHVQILPKGQDPIRL